eukprot:1390020-Prymnesium_polylepis.1
MSVSTISGTIGGEDDGGSGGSVDAAAGDMAGDGGRIGCAVVGVGDNEADGTGGEPSDGAGGD